MELIDTNIQRTQFGLIPIDWDIVQLKEIIKEFIVPMRDKPKNLSGDIPWCRIEDCDGKYLYASKSHQAVDLATIQAMNLKVNPENTLLVSCSADLGRCAIVKNPLITNQTFIGLVTNNKVNEEFLFYIMTKSAPRLNMLSSGTTISYLSREQFEEFKIPLPPTLTEQKAIATALSDVDALISRLDMLISKKKAIKQGAMQELLTPPHKGGKRLPGFSGDWEFLTIELVADCLDNLRVPLNGEQRSKMNGDIPYCGANGVVDYVNDFIIDDDIILMAEDGGYFDEYKTRPIAYRMKGKCWVNNHAHILKAKKGIDQGFLYFSLVHKNILDYINGGTRAKLNKGEMNKIECWFPKAKNEQKSIAHIFTDMDLEIESLENKKAKYQSIKQGMMQELLTGKTRLV